MSALALARAMCLSLLCGAIANLKVVGNCNCDPSANPSHRVSCTVVRGSLETSTDSPRLQYKCLIVGDGKRCQCCDCGAQQEEERGVVLLRESNFGEVVTRHDRLLVYFYAPWCLNCAETTQQLEKATVKLDKLEPPIKIAKVDVTRDPGLASSAGADETWTAVWSETHGSGSGSGSARAILDGEYHNPTIKLFKLGRVALDYSGPRQQRAADIIEWVTSNGGHPCAVLKNWRHAREFMSEASSAVVGFFPSRGDDVQMRRRIFCQVALSYPQARFALLQSKSVVQKLQLLGEEPSKDTYKKPHVGFFRRGALRNVLAAGNFSMEQTYTDFVESHVVVNFPPHVHEWSRITARHVADASIDNHLLIFGNRDSAALEPALRVLGVTAEQFEGSVLCIFMHAPDATRTMAALDVRLDHADDMHPVLYSRSRQRIRDWADWGGEFSVDGLRFFVSDFLRTEELNSESADNQQEERQAQARTSAQTQVPVPASADAITSSVEHKTEQNASASSRVASEARIQSDSEAVDADMSSKITVAHEESSSNALTIGLLVCTLGVAIAWFTLRAKANVVRTQNVAAPVRAERTAGKDKPDRKEKQRQKKEKQKQKKAASRNLKAAEQAQADPVESQERKQKEVAAQKQQAAAQAERKRRELQDLREAAEAKAAADMKLKTDSRAKAAKIAADAKSKAAKAKAAAEAEAKAHAHAQAQAKALAKAKAEADAKARADAEARALAKAKADQQAQQIAKEQESKAEAAKRKRAEETRLKQLSDEHERKRAEREAKAKKASESAEALKALLLKPVGEERARQRAAQAEQDRLKERERLEAELQAKKEAAQAAARAEAEAARREAEAAAARKAEEARLRKEAEDKRKAAEAEAEQKRQRAAEAKARLQKLREEAEARAKEEAIARAKAEEQAKREAEEQAKRAAEEQAKREAEEQAKRAAEKQAKREAEERAKREAEEQAKREAEAKVAQKATAKENKKRKDDKEFLAGKAVKWEKEKQRAATREKLHASFTPKRLRNGQQYSAEALFMLRAFCISPPAGLLDRLEELGMKEQLSGNPVAMSAAPPPRLPDSVASPASSRPKAGAVHGAIAPGGAGGGAGAPGGFSLFGSAALGGGLNPVLSPGRRDQSRGSPAIGSGRRNSRGKHAGSSSGTWERGLAPSRQDHGDE